MTPLFIPSPSQGVWHLGPFPIRAYALCIIAGVIAAVWLGERRWVARGGVRGQVSDVAIWAVPFGLVGARLYHVITDHELYFGAGRHPIRALEVWDGGLGIWGAIALGVLGGWLGCRRMGIRLPALMDALAPGLLLAQGIGRWGNYFNQELFGRPTTLPWGLKIGADHWPPQYASTPPSTVHGAGTSHEYAVFHPTFLYESIWDIGAMFVVLWLDRKLKLGFGRCFALYVMCYTVGRFWIEYLRVDMAADDARFLGLRFNDWTCIVCFAVALVCFVVLGRRHRKPDTREESPFREGYEPEPAEGAAASA